jgi:hypothetical protein
MFDEGYTGEPDKHETLKICGPSIFTFGRLEFADLLNGKQIVAIYFPIHRVFGISVLATRMQSHDLQRQLHNEMSDCIITSCGPE